jgi:hypothetical protein
MRTCVYSGNKQRTKAIRSLLIIASGARDLQMCKVRAQTKARSVHNPQSRQQDTALLCQALRGNIHLNAS